MKKVLCIGSVTTDIIVKPVDQVPTPGELWAVDSVSTHVGGCASNAAIDLAKLGVPVTLSCKVGKDNFGDFVIKTAKENGVCTDGIVTDDTVTTTTSIVCSSSTGERSFLYYPGSASVFRKEDVSDALIDSCDIVFVAGAMLLNSFDGPPCAQLMKEAQEKGKYTIMDTAWDFEGKWLPKIEAVIPYLDLFMPSYEEAAKLSGKTEVPEIARFFLDMGAKNVIIKVGKDGAFLHEQNGEEYTLPTYAAYKPVDTTGAGDSFCAGFIAGLAQGWSYRESGRFANAVGTHCILKIGASTGIVPIPQILKFMEENPL